MIRMLLVIAIIVGSIVLFAWDTTTVPISADQMESNDPPTQVAKRPMPTSAIPSASKQSIARKLPIPPRLQWRDRAGYCGECAIQQSALYYGSYVSQFVCREIIDTTQQQDVLVSVNAELVLDALRLKYDDFQTCEVEAPQYKAYLAWAKKHLHLGHPVILTMFVRGDECWDYDHIVLATGIESADHDSYHPDDTLYIHDLFHLEPEVRPFESLHDTREMRRNGEKHYFCIPEEFNFGCAITGIDDESGKLLPVRVTVDLPHEPDVVKNETPVDYTLGVTIEDLTPGETYVLYRYDDYQHLPNDDYHTSKYLSARTFVARSTTHEFTDQCKSNGASFYRCLKVANSTASN